MAVDDDMCGDGTHCTDHPYRTTSPGGGGICAFCLQDKLGKLVSSSSSSFFIASSSSSSPSFRSDLPSATSTSNVVGVGPPPTTTNNINSSRHHHQNSSSNSNSNSNSNSSSNQQHQHHEVGSGHHHHHHHRRARIPFLLTQKKKKKAPPPPPDYETTSTRSLVLKRSKSTSAPRSARYLNADYSQDFTPRPRSFWSFLHLSNHQKKPQQQQPSPVVVITNSASQTTPPPPVEVALPTATVVVVDESQDDSPNSSSGGSNVTSFGRKVSRSRSVGCGSRSFSGDFFERISTGFGDCTLRRVESQREGSKHRHSTSRAAGDTVREKARCGGLFGSLIITSSSSSSNSSTYWAGDGRPNGPTTTPLVHGRNRSWGWAFGSPMRAFTKPIISSTTVKEGRRKPELSSGGGGGIDGNSKMSNGTTPNLANIPSLLSMRG